MKHRVTEGLCKRAILQKQEHKVVLFLNRNVYPEVDLKPKQTILDRLEKAIFFKSEDIDDRTIILLSISYHANLLREIMDNDKWKEKNNHIKSLIHHETVGKAVNDTMLAMKILAAVILIFGYLLVSIAIFQ